MTSLVSATDPEPVKVDRSIIVPRVNPIMVLYDAQGQVRVWFSFGVGTTARILFEGLTQNIVDNSVADLRSTLNTAAENLSPRVLGHAAVEFIFNENTNAALQEVLRIGLSVQRGPNDPAPSFTRNVAMLVREWVIEHHHDGVQVLVQQVNDAFNDVRNLGYAANPPLREQTPPQKARRALVSNDGSPAGAGGGDALHNKLEKRAITGLRDFCRAPVGQIQNLIVGPPERASNYNPIYTWTCP